MSRAALFLDRDGVVNRDDDFVHRSADFHFTPGIFELVRKAATLGMASVVVTNQSGIARGLFTEDDYLTLDGWMRARFEAEGAALAGTYYCPFYPDAQVEKYRHPAHPWRKPAPGMLLAARDDHDLDLAGSALIGDRWSDVHAGAAAGLRHLALLGTRAESEPSPANPPAVTRLSSLLEAVAWLETTRPA